MRALLVGGPAHGQVQDVREVCDLIIPVADEFTGPYPDESSLLAEPAYAKHVYVVSKVSLFGTAFPVWVHSSLTERESTRLAGALLLSSVAKDVIGSL